ncbi:Kiwa anti-phage protein KwaB-like domain-containing protein [Paenibacillus hodogayensis]|uniref:Kiwa anti-phage protein KwaB-like domain-containing protein n=1 Tax=Paenibacillus hodogayensis TaxID=279208 RepID=A0ABV5VSA8_9BACL
MEKLLDEIFNDTSGESEGITLANFWDHLKYETSFFVKVSSSKKKWYIRNIDMAKSDQDIITELIHSLGDQYVDEYRLEDRDPDYIYGYKSEGLIRSSNSIQIAFADRAENEFSTESDNGEERQEITIQNFEGSSYPKNDEIKLIVHRLLIGKSKLLAFCSQTHTSLATASIRTRINNQLKSIEKDDYYKINNSISFLMTPSSYYIKSVDYFESLFSFSSQISRRKQVAMTTLADSQLIEGFDQVIPELNKGYMARSISMIGMNKQEMKDYVKKNKSIISTFCREYQAGVSFNSRTNKFTVIDGKTASLFLTYLFSNRMAQNIEGELVYFKTFGKLNKTAPVTT